MHLKIKPSLSSRGDHYARAGEDPLILHKLAYIIIICTDRRRLTAAIFINLLANLDSETIPIMLNFIIYNLMFAESGQCDTS